MSTIIDQAKVVLRRRQEFETSLTSTQAVLRSKEEAFEKFKKEVQQKFPGVNSLEDLQNLLKKNETELSQVLERIRVEAPELLQS